MLSWGKVVVKGLCVFLCWCRFVKNLKTKQEGWVTAANILTLIGESKSCQSLTSSGKNPSPCRIMWRGVCVYVYI